METYSTRDARRILAKIREQSIVKIYVDACPQSICALKMLVTILEREIIKYEINVVTVHESVIAEEYKMFINLWHSSYSRGLFLGRRDVQNLDRVVASAEQCPRNPYAAVLVYEMAESLNVIDNSILWPLAVMLDTSKCFYYREFESLHAAPQDKTSDDEELVDNTGCCRLCSNFYREVVLHAKRLNSAEHLDRVFLRHNIDLLFINNATLFTAVGNDIDFIVEKRLFSRKRACGDRDLKVKEFFAQLGVAKAETQEKFINVEHNTKKRLRSSLRSSFLFYKKVEYSAPISSLENYFGIWYFLLNSPVHAILSFPHDKAIDLGGPASLYATLVEIIKNNYLCIRPAKGARVLILTEPVRYRNRAMFLSLLHMLFMVIFRRQGKEFRLLIVHESPESFSVITSAKECASEYLQSVSHWSLDTFGMAFGVENDSLKLFYRRAFRK
eukprot:jgi/Antlo1/561/2324